MVTSIATSEAKHFLAADEIEVSVGSPRRARAAAVCTINRAASTFIAMALYLRPDNNVAKSAGREHITE